MKRRWAPASRKARRRSAQTSAGPIGSGRPASSSAARPTSGASTSRRTRSAAARSSVTNAQAVATPFAKRSGSPPRAATCPRTASHDAAKPSGVVL